MIRPNSIDGTNNDIYVTVQWHSWAYEHTIESRHRPPNVLTWNYQKVGEDEIIDEEWVAQSTFKCLHTKRWNGKSKILTTKFHSIASLNPSSHAAHSPGASPRPFSKVRRRLASRAQTLQRNHACITLAIRTQRPPIIKVLRYIQYFTVQDC